MKSSTRHYSLGSQYYVAEKVAPGEEVIEVIHGFVGHYGKGDDTHNHAKWYLWKIEDIRREHTDGTYEVKLIVENDTGRGHKLVYFDKRNLSIVGADGFNNHRDKCYNMCDVMDTVHDSELFL